MTTRAALALIAMLVAVLVAAPADGAPDLVVGASDDYVKTEPDRAGPTIQALGLMGVRVTFPWSPGQAALSAGDAKQLVDAIAAAGAARVFVAAYSRQHIPLTEAARAEYCTYLASIPRRFPEVTDVIVWNEPNKSTFWRPQFASGESAAPRDYMLLLAACYDALKAVSPRITVISAGLSSTGNDNPNASSNISHSPGNFLRKMGQAYRASGRSAPLFDKIGLHAYGESSAEPPWKRHTASSTIAMGDINTLLQAYADGFAGTGQAKAGRPAADRPVGTSGSQRGAADGTLAALGAVGIVEVLEIGFQTTEKEGTFGYDGQENVPTVARVATSASDSVDAVSQGSQLRAAVEIAYCHPGVGAFFNFLIRDDSDLSRWQSGLMHTDWTPKPAFDVYRQAIADVKARRIDCSSLAGGPIEPLTLKQGVDVKQVVWPKARSFNGKHDLWRFRVQTGEVATYVASVLPVGRSKPVLTASGSLKKLYLTMVRFPSRRLAPGRYRFEITLTSSENSARTTRLRGPTFEVQTP